MKFELKKIRKTNQSFVYVIVFQIVYLHFEINLDITYELERKIENHFVYKIQIIIIKKNKIDLILKES